MLEAIPKKLFSRDYTIVDNGVVVAELHFVGFREKGEITIESVPYKMYRAGAKGKAKGGAYILERDGMVLARCEKQSLWKNIWLVEYQDVQYTLKPDSIWGQGFALTLGEQMLGTIKPKGMGGNIAIADLPLELPLAVRAFMIWHVLLIWAREAAGAIVMAGIV